MRQDRTKKAGAALALSLVLCLVPGLLVPAAASAEDKASGHLVSGHTAKPGARVALAIEVLERAAPGESFRLMARVTPLAESDLVLLSWRGGPGLSLEGETAITLVAPPAGTPLEFELRGRWSGELPGRVYLAAEWQQAGRRVPQAVAASVIDAASEARLRRPAPRDGVRLHEIEP